MHHKIKGINPTIQAEIINQKPTDISKVEAILKDNGVPASAQREFAKHIHGVIESRKQSITTAQNRMGVYKAYYELLDQQ